MCISSEAKLQGCRVILSHFLRSLHIDSHGYHTISIDGVQGSSLCTSLPMLLFSALKKNSNPLMAMRQYCCCLDCVLPALSGAECVSLYFLAYSFFHERDFLGTYCVPGAVLDAGERPGRLDTPSQGCVWGCTLSSRPHGIHGPVRLRPGVWMGRSVAAEPDRALGKALRL